MIEVVVLWSQHHQKAAIEKHLHSKWEQSAFCQTTLLDRWLLGGSSKVCSTFHALLADPMAPPAARAEGLCVGRPSGTDGLVVGKGRGRRLRGNRARDGIATLLVIPLLGRVWAVSPTGSTETLDLRLWSPSVVNSYCTVSITTGWFIRGSVTSPRHFLDVSTFQAGPSFKSFKCQSQWDDWDHPQEEKLAAETTAQLEAKMGKWPQVGWCKVTPWV